MGMSTHVIGIKPADGRFKAMKKIWDGCSEMDVEVPHEVLEFFDHESPDESGVKVDLDEADGVTTYNADSEDGFEIDIRKLPPDIKIVRVFNAY